MPKEIWVCVDCGKQSTPGYPSRFKHKDNYCCYECWLKKPERMQQLERLHESMRGKPQTEEHRRKVSESKKGVERKPFSDEWISNMSEAQKGSKNHNYGKERNYDTRLQIVETKCGGIWYGAVTYSEYIACSKLEPIKQDVRNYFSHCVLCGCLHEENYGRDGVVRELAVHHALEEPRAFCNTETIRREILRKMMPRGVAQFGDAGYSDEELWYVRLVIPLCIWCHHDVTFSNESNKPYEETYYRKYFCELVKKYYDGKCF